MITPERPVTPFTANVTHCADVAKKWHEVLEHPIFGDLPTVTKALGWGNLPEEFAFPGVGGQAGPACQC